MNIIWIIIIALVLVYGYKSLRDNQMKKRAGNKVCPECKSKILASASKCPHCRHDFRELAIRRPLAIVLLIIIFGWFISGGLDTISSYPDDKIEPATKKPIVTFENTKAKQICSEHPSWSVINCNLLSNDRIWVGMSYDMLVYLRGKPDHKNVSNYGNGNEYQYCWNNHTPSCFYDENNDGILDAYN